MKKLTVILSSFLLFLAAAVSAQTVNVGFGAGAAYPKAPDTVAFDSELFVDIGINKYFAIGLESGFGWIKRESGDKIKYDGGYTTAPSSTNFYSVPVLAVITVYIPVSEYENSVKPYISGGAGYSWTKIAWSAADDLTFHGFTWQAVVGLDYNLGSDAGGMSVFLEAGYKGTDLQTKRGGKTYELDMSGFLGRIGLSFPIVSSSI